MSFTAEDIHTDGEETTIDLTVYNYELFDAVEVSKLAKGDTITADGNKIKVETVVEPEVAEPLIRKIVEEIKTGAYGDGKIFVYEVQDAVRIRTGERGSAAL